MTTTGGAAFTTTHWVIHRVHRNTTNAWATSKPAIAASLAQALVLVLVIADLTDRCTAPTVEVTDFTGRKFDCSAVAINGYQLSGLTSGTCDLCAAARVELDGVDLGCRWDHCEWHAVARLELDTLVDVEQHVTHLNTTWCQDVALFTVCVCKQSKVGGAVWIVFNRLHLGRDVNLRTTEVDLTIVALVTTTTTTCCDATIAVAALLDVLVLGETTLGLLVAYFLLVAGKKRWPGSKVWSL